LPDVALAAKAATERDAGASVLIFDDLTSRLIELDLRGSASDVLARLAAHEASDKQTSEPESDAVSASRGRGRPKLGVVAREVTLLPRHWEWLSAQSGGASVALRKLVEAARRESEGPDRIRAAREAAYRFASAIGGDLPGFEEAMRALFAGDDAAFEARIQAWPADIAAQLRTYAAEAFGAD
jgi:hypothetical protein